MATAKGKKPAPKKKPTPKAKALVPVGKAAKAVVAKAEKAKGGKKPRLFTAEDMAILKECAALGWTNKEIAEEIGIGETLFYEWKANNAEFADALTQARRRTHARIAKSIITRAEGGYVEEDQAIKIKLAGGGEDVKVVTLKKFIPADTQAAIYYLNNRDREHWKTFKAHEHSGPNGGPVQHEHLVPSEVVEEVKKLMEILK